MTRSNFDPTTGHPERSGSRYAGPAAENVSHLPPAATDGRAPEEEPDVQVDLGQAEEEPILQFRESRRRPRPRQPRS